MQQEAYEAHARALAAKDSQRAYATELACAQEQLLVKQESLRILRDKRLQLTQELTSLRKAEAETRKELNRCRSALDLSVGLVLDTSTCFTENSLWLCWGCCLHSASSSQSYQ